MTEPRYDRWGRYILPDPTTGKDRSWTRATTFAGTIADTYGLTAWKMRMVAKGIAQRPDLLALAAATPIEDKKKLDGVASDALEAAGASAGANLGEALHRFTEQLDRGEAPEIPELWQPDLDAYRATVVLAGLERFPQWIERVVLCERLSVAGTFDRIVRVDGTYYVADVKTGADLSYAWGEIAVQLALYAHADWMWEPEFKRWSLLPALDRERALVIHLPVRQARCDLYWVDIAAGWETAQLCGAVREWRSRKDLSSPAAETGKAGEPQPWGTGLPSSDSSKTGDGPGDSSGGERADPAEQLPIAVTVGGTSGFAESLVPPAGDREAAS